ncbi:MULTISPECIES: carbohydrate ABC transporter permease [Paenibacillus]|uniref:Carbohydrate ABC transporter permease n=1 Tax=Paenibacillus violae TaxID=3077234 RepID=A0ABU3RC13_9BACL|nr:MULTISPECIES: carbohydrate ABC transporter permease [Paenibacillus]MDU0201788.1 carbohydrate ABC transporter permease [Paenibacillus sp. PFR10]MEC0267833.1 carbohydrate ABC transporter permease [Paenibacillus anseongense]
MIRNRGVGSRIFDGANYLSLFLVAVITFIPFYYVIVASLSPIKQVLTESIILWPEKFTLTSYHMILTTPSFVRALLFTLFITVVGTAINMLFTSTLGYSLSKKRFRARRAILMLIVFSMMFSGGLIPTYLVVKQLGMINSLWALMLPGAISAFNLIVLKNFFASIPQALEDSARIDGCSNFGIFMRIALPLSLPALASFTLFYAVGNWNQFFAAIMYMNNSRYWTLQVVLRQLVIIGDSTGYGQVIDDANKTAFPETLKYAAIVVATLPILLVYPFLQKYFVKGVLMGSVKE